MHSPAASSHTCVLHTRPMTEADAGDVWVCPGPVPSTSSAMLDGSALAPSRALLLQREQGTITHAVFAARYHVELSTVERREASLLDRLRAHMLARGDVALICTCATARTCHRGLLADFLARTLESPGLRIIRRSELRAPDSASRAAPSTPTTRADSAASLDLFDDGAVQ